jgi:hypothetical protein
MRVFQITIKIFVFSVKNTEWFIVDIHCIYVLHHPRNTYVRNKPLSVFTCT